MHSPLSRVGSTLGIEKGVTRDRRTESELGHLTGRGNRRPEVIFDVTSIGRKSPSVGDRLGIPTDLGNRSSNAGLETIHSYKHIYVF